MRVVIESDQPDKDQGIGVGPGDGAQTVIDAGPAPASLLRRFGRVPEHAAEAMEEDAALRDEEGLNPLRAGAAAARHARAEEPEDAEPGDVAHEDAE